MHHSNQSGTAGAPLVRRRGAGSPGSPMTHVDTLLPGPRMIVPGRESRSAYSFFDRESHRDAKSPAGAARPDSSPQPPFAFRRAFSHRSPVFDDTCRPV